jgi:hypothetical protein
MLHGVAPWDDSKPLHCWHQLNLNRIDIDTLFDQDNNDSQTEISPYGCAPWLCLEAQTESVDWLSKIVSHALTWHLSNYSISNTVAMEASMRMKNRANGTISELGGCPVTGHAAALYEQRLIE